MKTKSSFIALALLALSTLNSQLSTAHAQGTAFTYQGQLQKNGSPVNGSYDMIFTLFNTNMTGSSSAGPVLVTAISVNNGLFTTAIDFGPGAFIGTSNWLEIAVRPAGTSSFTTLAPRQPLTPAPYAITAENLASVVQNNTITPGSYNTVGGGQNNTNGGAYGTVSGGLENLVNSVGEGATVGGGFYNSAINDSATVGGGDDNTASGQFATVGGGAVNFASGFYATVAGGYENSASGFAASVPGGYHNSASGAYSFAGGYEAQAPDYGCFVWADESGGSFASTANDQFAVRAAGGVLLAADVQIGTSAADYHHMTFGGGNSEGFIYGSYPALGDGISMGYNYYFDAAGTGHAFNPGGQTSRITAGYETVTLAIGGIATAPNGVRLLANASGVTVYGTFNNSSDRNVKQDFAPVNSSQILDKVLQLPITEWSYKEDAAARHIGPMGQDFHSLFKIGTDEKHIAPIDEGGVAFAAIQGLNEKVEGRSQQAKDQIEELKVENAELKHRLEALEKTVLNQKSN